MYTKEKRLQILWSYWKKKWKEFYFNFLKKKKGNEVFIFNTIFIVDFWLWFQNMYNLKICNLWVICIRILLDTFFAIKFMVYEMILQNKAKKKPPTKKNHFLSIKPQELFNVERQTYMVLHTLWLCWKITSHPVVHYLQHGWRSTPPCEYSKIPAI